MGQAVLIDRSKLSPDEQKEFDQGWKQHQFNEYVSDRISVHRTLPDFRDPQ